MFTLGAEGDAWLHAARDTLARVSVTFDIDASISGVPGDEPVTVRVPVDDVERVAGWLASMPRFQVQGDPSVEGGCHVESRYGYVEATTDQAFAALEAATRAWVEEG